MPVSKKHHHNTAGALERCKSFSFDVNQQAESLVKWEQRYNQHSGGVFTGYLDELKLGGIHFFEEFTNRTLQQQCCLKEDNLWLGFSLQAQRPKINNDEIMAGQIMTRPSDIEFELITPEDFHIYGLVLEKGSLDNEMVGLDETLWHNRSNEVKVSMPNHFISYELAKLISLLLSNNSMATAQSQLLDISNINRLNTLKPFITSKVADLLMQIEYASPEEKVASQTKQRVVAKVNNYIKTHNRYPLTISELCQITNVSRRSLQYCFQEGFGMSPIQYIRDCRLNEIRRILLNSDREIAIADIALSFGFFHLGTFNSQYKHLFGETPTQTIQRATHYQHSAIKIL